MVIPGCPTLTFGLVRGTMVSPARSPGRPTSSPSFPLLLPSGNEERGVFGFGSIPVALFPSCHYVKILYHNCIDVNIVGNKNKKHLRGSTQATIHPLAIILTAALWALVSITA